MNKPHCLAVAVVLGLIPTLYAHAAERAGWAEAMAGARAQYLQSPEAQKSPARDSLFKPFDSGPIDAREPARQVTVNVAGLDELRLVAACVKRPANCNIWGSRD